MNRRTAVALTFGAIVLLAVAALFGGRLRNDRQKYAAYLPPGVTVSSLATSGDLVPEYGIFGWLQFRLQGTVTTRMPTVVEELERSGAFDCGGLLYTATGTEIVIVPVSNKDFEAWKYEGRHVLSVLGPVIE